MCRTDELKRQYIGVLCGLGSDPSTGESIYHEHDMELSFDTYITNQDIATVSQGTTTAASSIFVTPIDLFKACESLESPTLASVCFPIFP